MKKVAIFCLNNRKNYSGGRIHALTLAYGIAANQHIVDFYTNNKPIFADEFETFPGKSNLTFNINKFFAFFNIKKYDLLIVVPHLATKKSFVIDRIYYKLVRIFKAVSKCQLVYIDFESPNWFNEMIPGGRAYNLYKYSDKIIPAVDYIISTTKIGSEYAKKYYIKFNQRVKFLQLYLAINSLVADRVGQLPKKKQVLFFGRFNETHKNPNVIVDILSALPEQYTLKIITNNDNISPNLLDNINSTASAFGVNVVFLKNISEEEKFIQLATSALLVYSSSFEGYGLPPIEAQYMGTPVICSDLPVLREVNKEAEFVNFTDTALLSKKIDKMLTQPPTSSQLKRSVESYADFRKFTENIKEIIDSIT